MKKYITVLCFLISSSSIALEFVGDTQYEEACYFSGWNCHKVSKEEKKHLLNLLREDVSSYLKYYKNIENENVSNNLGFSVYQKAASICQKIYLLNPDANECNVMHCIFQRDRWLGDAESFNKDFKEECR